VVYHEKMNLASVEKIGAVAQGALQHLQAWTAEGTGPAGKSAKLVDRGEVQLGWTQLSSDAASFDSCSAPCCVTKSEPFWIMGL
jgi:hypothetical protein